MVYTGRKTKVLNTCIRRKESFTELELMQRQGRVTSHCLETFYKDPQYAGFTAIHVRFDEIYRNYSRTRFLKGLELLILLVLYQNLCLSHVGNNINVVDCGRDKGEVAYVAAMAIVVAAAANKGSGCGGYDDEVKAVVPAVDGYEGKGRGGAYYSGSGRSGGRECFWVRRKSSPKKFSGSDGGGRRVVTPVGREEGGRGAVCVFHVYKNEMKMI
nr:hypothetical protein [Tanacetum cinerariifolium]